MDTHLASLLAEARRHSRVASEAEDLLQDALLEAVRAGREDVTQAVNYRWVVGTLRKLGTMQARSAGRRRLREERWSTEQAGDDAGPPIPAAPGNAVPEDWRRHPAVAALPPSLKQVALLALSGHDRREVAWLLGLSDTALRQRISTLRKRLSAFEALPSSTGRTASGNDLPLGLIRRALLPVVRASGSAGTHDPDGHLILLGPPRAVGTRGAHIPPVGGNKRVRGRGETPDPPPLSTDPSAADLPRQDILPRPGSRTP